MYSVPANSEFVTGRKWESGLFVRKKAHIAAPRAFEQKYSVLTQETKEEEQNDEKWKEKVI